MITATPWLNLLPHPGSDATFMIKPSDVAVCNKIRTTDDQCLCPPVTFISDSVRCNALIQSSGSYAFSCHTFDKLLDKDDAKPSLELNWPSNPPLWGHVFSKSSSTTSLRTQCAAAAYLDMKSPKVLHQRLRRAKRKLNDFFEYRLTKSPKVLHRRLRHAKWKLNDFFECRLTIFGGEVVLKNYEMKILSIV